MKVLVAGVSGKTGRLVLEQLSALARKTSAVVSGDTPIAEALARL